MSKRRLRRVATLVARGAPPAEVFQAVTAEVAQLVPAEAAVLTRFDTDSTVTAVGGAAAGGYAYVGTQFEREGHRVRAGLRAGPARADRELRGGAWGSRCRRT